VRADRANSSDDENGSSVEDEMEGRFFWNFCQGKDFDVTSCAKGRSRCDEALGLLHPPTVSLREDEDLVLLMKDRVRDGGPN
jgi:hypothetical protein